MAIGVVVAAATLVGVPLFGDDVLARTRQGAHLARQLELLPQAAPRRRQGRRR